MMKPTIQKAAATILSISMTGCSFFGSRTQTITVSSDPTGAAVHINGERVGNTPIRYDVSRRGDLLVEVRRDGYEAAYRQTHRGLSTLGIADLIGGSVILLPFLGLLSPAAWQQEPASFGITLDPIVTPREAAKDETTGSTQRSDREAARDVRNDL